MDPRAATEASRGRLLVLDYPGHRTEARVCDLHLEDYGYTPTSMLTSPLPTELDGRRYAERLRVRISGPATPAVAVLAYCASARIAREVAAMLPGRPALVLFDAEDVTEETIASAYLSAIAEYNPAVVAAACPGELRTDPDTALCAMLGRISELATAAFRAEGCDPAESDSLGRQTTAAWQDWLTHLIAAYRSEPARWDGRILHVTSAGYRQTGGWWDSPSVRAVQCDVGQAELLRSATARAAVLDFLAD